MRSIPPSSSATRATTATAFATTWRSEASNPSSRRDRTVRRQSNTIGKPTSGATSSSGASIASSNSGASPPDTRKPPELTFRCYASQQRNSGSKPSTRPSLFLTVAQSGDEITRRGEWLVSHEASEYVTECTSPDRRPEDCGSKIGHVSYYVLRDHPGNFCPVLPRLGSRSQDVIEWLRNHPETLKRSAWDGIQVALLALYPCKK